MAKIKLRATSKLLQLANTRNSKKQTLLHLLANQQNADIDPTPAIKLLVAALLSLDQTVWIPNLL